MAKSCAYGPSSSRLGEATSPMFYALVRGSVYFPCGGLLGNGTVDGRNPFRTTFKPWLKPLFIGIYRGTDSFLGF